MLFLLKISLLTFDFVTRPRGCAVAIETISSTRRNALPFFYTATINQHF